MAVFGLSLTVVQLDSVTMAAIATARARHGGTQPFSCFQ
jgi:hypothetical protein